LLVHPFLRYRVVAKVAKPAYQYITIQMTDLMLTLLYIPPSAKAEEERERLRGIEMRSQRDRAVIMGDLNSRHLDWDKRTNRRGRWLRA